ncbi:MAG: DUF4365 domain-containing protein [Parvibaculaceae bacterium]
MARDRHRRRGIDGQLEFVTGEGFATGRTVAAQVKTGPSFFQHRGKRPTRPGAQGGAGAFVARHHPPVR